jgi:hypothetical protein
MDDDLIRTAAFTWLKGQVDNHGEIKSSGTRQPEDHPPETPQRLS